MTVSGFWPVTILVGVFVILQSTVLKNVRIFDVKPDVAFIIFMFTSTRQGSFRSELTGFSTGLVQDFLSLAPLGFNALIRTIIGFVYGLLRGRFFLDP
ncbi:MAG TPA: rod shape-determining protein MreD, partial [Spirochaetia bacterium]|nr:rod shape-determining protein MreD [Spirochaetia bacterium]